MGLGALLESLRLFFVCQSACCVDVRDSVINVAEEAGSDASSLAASPVEFVPAIFSAEGDYPKTVLN